MDKRIKVVDKKMNEGFTFLKLIINLSSKFPEIQTIGYLTAMVGEEFIYQVNASNPGPEKLLFFDDTNLFDIDRETGIIAFVPENLGNHSIMISVLNENGYRVEVMELEIK